MYSLLTKVHRTVVEVTFLLPTSREASLLSDQSLLRAESFTYIIQVREFWFVPGDVKSRQMNMDNLVLFWGEVAEMKKYVLSRMCSMQDVCIYRCKEHFLKQKLISLYSDPWSNFCKTVWSSYKIAPAHRWVLQSSSTWLWRLMFFFFPVEGFVRNIW